MVEKLSIVFDGFVLSAKFKISQKEQIKAGLRTREISLSKIGFDLGIKPSTVSGVLAGRRSARVEQKIAEALDTTAQELFPDRKHKARLQR